jgi:pimeloyl-ACP methyl ester carboxylesterase
MCPRITPGLSLLTGKMPDGTAMDTSLILDYISAYAFPANSIQISQHIVFGISLGGHAAWHCILHDPRITTAIICIGCPDYTRLMSDRARLSKLPTYTQSNPPGHTFVGSSDFPQGLVEAVNRYDPAGLFWSQLKTATPGQEHLYEVSHEDKVGLAPLLARTLGHKRILNLSGGADKLVPYRCGEPFLSWLKTAIGKGGWYEQGGIVFEDMVFEGVGHEVPYAMVKELVRFVGKSLEGETEMTVGKRGSREYRI